MRKDVVVSYTPPHHVLALAFTFGEWVHESGGVVNAINVIIDL